MKENLKPCPFCGSAAKEKCIESSFKVICSKPQCVASYNYRWFSSQEEAEKHWNDRVSCIPPANIGDNVYSILENPDCDDVNFIATTISDSGNVFSIFTFQVHGYAYIDGTWYLTDFDRELLEVGKDVYVSKTEAMEALRKLVKTSRNEESQ